MFEALARRPTYLATSARGQRRSDLEDEGGVRIALGVKHEIAGEISSDRLIYKDRGPASGLRDFQRRLPERECVPPRHCRQRSTRAWRNRKTSVCRGGRLAVDWPGDWNATVWTSAPSPWPIALAPNGHLLSCCIPACYRRHGQAPVGSALPLLTRCSRLHGHKHQCHHGQRRPRSLSGRFTSAQSTAISTPAQREPGRPRLL